MPNQNESPNHEIEEIDVDAIIERIDTLEKENISFKKIQAELRAEFDELSQDVADLASAVDSLGDEK